MVDIDKHSVQEWFKELTYISKEDLGRFFKEQEEDIKEATIRWRIHQMKEKGVLTPVKRGVYTLSKKPPFDPAVTKTLKQLYSQASSSFVDPQCTLWSTEWLAVFMELQPAHSFTVFEIEKELVQQLFHLLKDGNKEVFLNPDNDMMLNYILDKKNPIIIRSLISRAPVQKTNKKVPIAPLEKILVDIFCDNEVFIAYQGSELRNIFANAWKIHSLNLSTLLNYARRRRRSEQLLDFLQQNANELFKLLKS